MASESSSSTGSNRACISSNTTQQCTAVELATVERKQQVMEEVTKGKLVQLASTTACIGQTGSWIRSRNENFYVNTDDRNQILRTLILTMEEAV